MKNALPLIFCVAFVYIAGAEIHTINTNSSSFSPATLSIPLGDTVIFNVNITHTATQVSESTWNSNGLTPLPGGFNFTSAGTHQFVPSSLGTHYYVCQNHVEMGMKGTITVNPPTGIARPTSDASIRVFPSITRDILRIESSRSSLLNLNIFNARGELVYELSGLSASEVLSIKHFANGLYFGLLTDHERSYWWKFFKN